jgi:hypothetical protein
MKTTLIIWLLCATVFLWGCVDTVKEIYIPVPIPSIKIPWITYLDTKNEKCEVREIEYIKHNQYLLDENVKVTNKLIELENKVEWYMLNKDCWEFKCWEKVWYLDWIAVQWRIILYDDNANLTEWEQWAYWVWSEEWYNSKDIIWFEYIKLRKEIHRTKKELLNSL